MIRKQIHRAKIIISFLFIPSLFAFGCHYPIKNISEEGRIILKGVPLIIQKRDLDCSMTSRAMLLKFFNNQISYEKTLYESGACHAFIYIPGYLRFMDLGFNGGFMVDFKWLGDLYGLKFTMQRIAVEGEREIIFFREAPTEIVKGEGEAWIRYLELLEYYLRKGVPVQTSKSWKPSPLGSWWDGILEKNRPGNHWITITGLDRVKGYVYINSPWPTLGKIVMGLEDFKKSI